MIQDTSNLEQLEVCKAVNNFHIPDSTHISACVMYKEIYK